MRIVLVIEKIFGNSRLNFSDYNLFEQCTRIFFETYVKVFKVIPGGFSDLIH